MTNSGSSFDVSIPIAPTTLSLPSDQRGVLRSDRVEENEPLINIREVYF